MKITDISSQVKNKDRVNVSVDGTYRFSLDVFQVGEIGIKIGHEYSEDELVELETESQFGKLYGRSLEYCLMRSHSAKEMRDYLYRKTRDRRDQTGKVKQGVSADVTKRVFERLEQKGYIDDEKFARHWIENRDMTKGASARKLTSELRAKGVEQAIIDVYLSETDRSDQDELIKVISKKRRKYPDNQKFMQYLAGKGFRYDDIKQALSDD